MLKIPVLTESKLGFLDSLTPLNRGGEAVKKLLRVADVFKSFGTIQKLDGFIGIIGGKVFVLCAILRGIPNPKC